jgi:hypothetical protein
VSKTNKTECFVVRTDFNQWPLFHSTKSIQWSSSSIYLEVFGRFERRGHQGEVRAGERVFKKACWKNK